jgi:hypothetical protein
MTGDSNWRPMLPTGGGDAVPRESGKPYPPKSTVVNTQSDESIETTNVSTFCTKTSQLPSQSPSAVLTRSKETQSQSSMRTTARPSDSVPYATTSNASSPTTNPRAGSSSTTSDLTPGSSDNSDTRLSIGGVVGTAIGSAAAVVGIYFSIKYGRSFLNANRGVSANRNSNTVIVMQDMRQQIHR